MATTVHRQHQEVNCRRVDRAFAEHGGATTQTDMRMEGPGRLLMGIQPSLIACPPPPSAPPRD